MAGEFGQGTVATGGILPRCGTVALLQADPAEMLREVLQRRLARGAQDVGVVLRRDREAVFEVVGVELAGGGIETQGQVAGGQRLAVGRAEERRQQPVLQHAVRRFPVDVEEASVGALAAPFQHVQPPGVVLAADPHVVRHDIQDQPEPGRLQRRHQPAERRLAAELGVDLAVVDDVVAMGGPGRAFRIGEA